MATDTRELFQLATAAHRGRDFSRAVEICDSILAQSGDQPEILNLKAVALAEGGWMILAKETILKALRAAETRSIPEARAMLHLHAARILAALDLYHDALDHAGRAAELRPDDPAGAYQLARLALLAGNTNQARGLICDCLERFPGFTEARMLECQMAMEAGDPESAVASLEAVIAREPLHARALSGQAAISLSLRDDVSAAMWTIHNRGPAAEIETGDWASVTFALADSHVRTGEFGEAFKLYNDANRNLASHTSWDMESWMSRVNRTLQTAVRHKTGSGQSLGPNPLFIVGMPRSGTSLLESILGSHPQISMGGERESLSHIERHLGRSGAGHAASGIGIREIDVREMSQLYRAGMQSTAETAWVTDKANRNFERLGLAMRLFPASRVVWILRHPLDTILSCYFQDFQHGLGFTHSLAHLAVMYRLHLELMHRWIECFGESILLLTYSELVRDTEAVVRRLSEFLDLEFHPAMLQPHLLRKPVRTSSTMQVQRPIHDKGLGRWRNFRVELAEVIEDLRGHGIISAEFEMVLPGTGSHRV